MPGLEHLLAEAAEAREVFENGVIPRGVLAELYVAYNPDVEIEGFLDYASQLFPGLNCGLASVYLQHKLGEGEVVNGS